MSDEVFASPSVLRRQKSLLKDPASRPQLEKKCVSWSPLPAEKKIVHVKDCINLMRSGLQMMKICPNGRFYMRNYWLTEDLEQIQWYPSQKKSGKAKLAISSIREIRPGRRSTSFNAITSTPLTIKDECSFVIVHGADYDTLSLVAENSRDANVWVSGLKCLLATSTAAANAAGDTVFDDPVDSFGQRLSSDDASLSQESMGNSMRERWLLNVYRNTTCQQMDQLNGRRSSDALGDAAKTDAAPSGPVEPNADADVDNGAVRFSIDSSPTDIDEPTSIGAAQLTERDFVQLIQEMCSARCSGPALSGRFLRRKLREFRSRQCSRSSFENEELPPAVMSMSAGGGSLSDSQSVTTPTQYVSFEEFKSIYLDISTRSEIYHLLVRHASHPEYLTSDEFIRFLESEQDSGHVSQKRCRELIEQFEPSLEGRLKLRLGLDGFTNYLMSLEHCDIFSPTHHNVCQNMTLPLANYFIATSHNTYLSGDQLRSESVPTRYGRVLSAGCRCVELDIWDGDSADTPLVYNGHTLTSRVPLRDCLEQISTHAFSHGNPYPVIISVENHCSVEQQLVVTELFRSILGNDRLLSWDEAALHEQSPEALHGRFLIRANRPICALPDPTGGEAFVCPDDDDSNDLELNNWRLQMSISDQTHKSLVNCPSPFVSRKLAAAAATGDLGGNATSSPRATYQLTARSRSS